MNAMTPNKSHRMIGIATLAAALAPYAVPLQIASALVLLALGGFGLWQAWQIDSTQETTADPGANQAIGRIYLRFLGLTLLNPLTIAYFGALILGRDAGTTVTALDRLLFVFGAALASLSPEFTAHGHRWYAVEVLIARVRRKLPVSLIETRRGFGYTIADTP